MKKDYVIDNEFKSQGDVALCRTQGVDRLSALVFQIDKRFRHTDDSHYDIVDMTKANGEFFRH